MRKPASDRIVELVEKELKELNVDITDDQRQALTIKRTNVQLTNTFKTLRVLRDEQLIRSEDEFKEHLDILITTFNERSKTINLVPGELLDDKQEKEFVCKFEVKYIHEDDYLKGVHVQMSDLFYKEIEDLIQYLFDSVVVWNNTATTGIIIYKYEEVNP